MTFATIDEHEITEPQATPSHERAIVFDGRLSNVQDIQNELDLHRLNGDKDAEIVLHYFEESGTSIFGKMEGEFALALVDELPEQVIWRGKSKFWQGSGTGEQLSQYAEHLVSDEDFQNHKDIGEGNQLNSKEEYLYYQIFKDCFGCKIPLNEVGRTKHI